MKYIKEIDKAPQEDGEELEKIATACKRAFCEQSKREVARRLYVFLNRYYGVGNAKHHNDILRHKKRNKKW